MSNSSVIDRNYPMTSSFVITIRRYAERDITEIKRERWRETETPVRYGLCDVIESKLSLVNSVLEVLVSRLRSFPRFCHAFTVKPVPKIKHTPKLCIELQTR